MRSDSKSKPAIPVTPFRFIGLIALSLFLVTLVSFCCTPIDSAWGKTNIHTKEQQRNRPENQGVESPSEGYYIAEEAPPRTRVDYTFTDENTGTTITHSSAYDAEEYTPPSIQAVQVERGEAALHAEGTCAACDELRAKFRAGEVDALYCLKVVPDIETEDEFALSAPLDEEMHSYAILQCLGGELDVTYSPMFVGSNSSSKTYSAVSISGSLSKLQSPFGITYNATRPSESDAAQSNSSDGRGASNTRFAPPAQTPDNDGGDGDDDEDSNSFPLGGVLFFAIVALGVIGYFLPSKPRR